MKAYNKLKRLSLYAIGPYIVGSALVLASIGGAVAY